MLYQDDQEKDGEIISSQGSCVAFPRRNVLSEQRMINYLLLNAQLVFQDSSTSDVFATSRELHHGLMAPKLMPSEPFIMALIHFTYSIVEPLNDDCTCYCNYALHANDATVFHLQWPSVSVGGPYYIENSGEGCVSLPSISTPELFDFGGSLFDHMGVF